MSPTTTTAPRITDVVGLSPEQQALAQQMGHSAYFAPIEATGALQQLQEAPVRRALTLEELDRMRQANEFNRATRDARVEATRLEPQRVQSGIDATRQSTLESQELLPLRKQESELDITRKRYETNPEVQAIETERRILDNAYIRENTARMREERLNPKSTTPSFTPDQVVNNWEGALGNLYDSALKGYIESDLLMTDQTTGRLRLKDPALYKSLEQHALRNAVKNKDEWAAHYVDTTLYAMKNVPGFSPRTIPGFTSNQSKFVYDAMLNGAEFDEAIDQLFKLDPSLARTEVK